MRIIWLAHGFEGHGPRRTILTLMEAVTARGHEVGLLATTGGELADDVARRGIPVRSLELPVSRSVAGRSRQRLSAVVDALAFERRHRAALDEAMHDLRPDVIHVLRPTFLAVAGRLGRRHDAAVIWQPTDNVRRSRGFSRPLALYQATLLRWDITPLAISPTNAASLRPGPVEPVTLPLGVDGRTFDPERVRPVARADLGIDDRVALVMVGRVDPSKGQDLVLEAILTDAGLHGRLALLCVGQAFEESYLRRLVELAERSATPLVVTGTVDDPERYLAVADIAVNASRFTESFGLAVVEALMMGTPVLTRAHGAPRDWVADGGTGWHVPEPLGPATFLVGLRRALDDRDCWEEMGRRARSVAMRQHDVDLYADRYLEIAAAAHRRRRG